MSRLSGVITVNFRINVSEIWEDNIISLKDNYRHSNPV